MLSKCKICGNRPRSYTYKDGIFSEAYSYIRCSCGNQTDFYYSFWASDANEKARREWEEKLSKTDISKGT